MTKTKTCKSCFTTCNHRFIGVQNFEEAETSYRLWTCGACGTTRGDVITKPRPQDSNRLIISNGAVDTLTTVHRIEL